MPKLHHWLPTLIVSTCAAALPAAAGPLSTYSNGFVVPNVIHNGAADTTVVHILARDGGSPLAIDWWFYNEAGQVTASRGCLQTAGWGDTPAPFVWSDHAAGRATAQRGYLLFAVRDSAQCTGSARYPNNPEKAITSDAYQVNTVANRVAARPVIDGPVSIFTVTGRGPVLNDVGGAESNTRVFTARYRVDGAPGGTDTRLLVWSLAPQGGQHVAHILRNDGYRISVNLNLPNAHQNQLNVEAVVGRPASYTEGAIQWKPYSGTGSIAPQNGKTFVYSILESPAFTGEHVVLGATR